MLRSLCVHVVTVNCYVAQELGIRVVPTFKILKDNKVIKEVVGAKFDELLAAIEAARSG
ncbi:hypothetical protein F2Q70_00014383 [Brassica cretica]|uniref:Thioredoxin domain-containing protein n=1 Tax=Brassica cretica TaxID=69181 RepID=A0A8S9HVI7_BRACR|nr:hypothetical protein F2Q70_00014383 [Brassica cretica]